MASRRRAANLMAGMRLGDMAAALEGRQMRRQDRRMDDEREARRLQAANMAIGQVLGAFGDYQERQRQDARQAMLDAERRSDREFERSRLTAEDERRAADHAAKVKERALALLSPGLDARADEALAPDAVGAWIFGGDLDDPDDVQIVDARGNALHDMVALLEGAEFSRAEAESLAKDALRRAEVRRGARDFERRKQELDLALLEARAGTEEARQRKLDADRDWRRRRGPGAGSSPSAPAPKKTVADYAPDETLPPELRAHPEVTKKMVEYELLEASIDAVKAAKDQLGVDTGPVRGLLGEFANFMGVEAIEPAALRAMTGAVFADYVHSISGAAASDKEVQRLMKNMATMRDQDDVFRAKLEVMKRLVQIRKDALLRTYQKAGFPLGRWTVSPEPEPASGAASAQTTAPPRGGASLTPEQIQALRAHEQALLSAGMEPGQVKEKLRVMMAQMRGGA